LASFLSHPLLTLLLFPFSLRDKTLRLAWLFPFGIKEARDERMTIYPSLGIKENKQKEILLLSQNLWWKEKNQTFNFNRT
jgi:hypothetical protein